MDKTPKKILVHNFIRFLNKELDDNTDLTDEEKESVEVAIQCLETAFHVEGVVRRELQEVDLISLVSANQPREPSPEDIGRAEEFKNAGNSLMKEGRYDEALVQYTHALAANPHNAVYYCNRAAAYSRLDRHQDAIYDCKEAIRLDPAYGKAYGRLGIAFSNLSMYREAEGAYAEALRLDPNNQMYETNLRLARERLAETAGPSSSASQAAGYDFSQIVNNNSFMTMAREVMNNPEFIGMVSNVLALGQSGDNNFEALFKASQNLQNRMQGDPSFLPELRRPFLNETGTAGQTAQNPPETTATNPTAARNPPDVAPTAAEPNQVPENPPEKDHLPFRPGGGPDGHS